MTRFFVSVKPTNIVNRMAKPTLLACLLLLAASASAFAPSQSSVVWKRTKTPQRSLRPLSLSPRPDEVVTKTTTKPSTMAMQMDSLEYDSSLTTIDKASARDDSGASSWFWKGTVVFLCALWASNFAAIKLVVAEPGVDSSLYAVARFGLATAALLPFSAGKLLPSTKPPAAPMVTEIAIIR